MEKFSCQRSAWMDHARVPVARSIATRRPSSSPSNTLSWLSATPLLFHPQQTDVMLGSTFDDHCQRISPVSIESANTSLAPVLTKATPLSTSGCAKPEYCGCEPDPRRRVRHTPFKPATFVRLIASSGEKR